MLRHTKTSHAGFPLYGLAYLRAGGWVPPEKWRTPLPPTGGRIQEALKLRDPCPTLLKMPPTTAVVSAMARAAERLPPPPPATQRRSRRPGHSRREDDAADGRLMGVADNDDVKLPGKLLLHAYAGIARHSFSLLAETANVGRGVCTVTAERAVNEVTWAAERLTTHLEPALQPLQLEPDVLLARLYIAALQHDIEAADATITDALEAGRGNRLTHRHYHAAMAAASRVASPDALFEGVGTFRFAASVYARMAAHGLPATFETVAHLANAITVDADIDEVVELYTHLAQQVPAKRTLRGPLPSVALTALIAAVGRAAPVGEAIARSVDVYRRAAPRFVQESSVPHIRQAFALPAARALDASRAQSIYRDTKQEVFDPFTGAAFAGSHGSAVHEVLQGTQLLIYLYRQHAVLPPSATNSFLTVLGIHARTVPELDAVSTLFFNTGLSFRAVRDTHTYAICLGDVTRRCVTALARLPAAEVGASANSTRRAAEANAVVGTALRSAHKLLTVMRGIDGIKTLSGPGLGVVLQLAGAVGSVEGLLSPSVLRARAELRRVVESTLQPYGQRIVTAGVLAAGDDAFEGQEEGEGAETAAAVQGSIHSDEADAAATALAVALDAELPQDGSRDRWAVTAPKPQAAVPPEPLRFTAEVPVGYGLASLHVDATATELGSLAASSARLVLTSESLVVTDDWAPTDPRLAAVRVFIQRGGRVLSPVAAVGDKCPDLVHLGTAGVEAQNDARFALPSRRLAGGLAQFRAREVPSIIEEPASPELSSFAQRTVASWINDGEQELVHARQDIILNGASEEADDEGGSRAPSPGDEEDHTGSSGGLFDGLDMPA